MAHAKTACSPWSEEGPILSALKSIRRIAEKIVKYMRAHIMISKRVLVFSGVIDCADSDEKISAGQHMDITIKLRGFPILDDK